MIDDKLLRQHVLDELAWDARIDATHVAMTASDGAVTVTGHVPSYAQLFAVAKAVQRVQGVKAVANDLEVKLVDSERRDDEAIATSVAHVLECNLSPTENDVRADVRGGVVVLTGTVDWQHQRRHVEKQVAHVTGVTYVDNRITLVVRAVPEDVAARIEAALRRNARLESEHISVSVKDDEVVLEGNVHAFYERNLVEAACWLAPGVRKVTDRITVG